MATYEKTSSKNPRRLAVRQHVVSRAHIARFVDNSGFVAVYFVPIKKLFRAKPDNDVFLVKRYWDHSTETRFFKKYEDQFQNHVEDIFNGKPIKRDIVSAYASIWSIRLKLAENAPEDVKLTGITPSNLTQEQQETLEFKGAAFVRASGMPGRMYRKLDVICNHDWNMSKLSGRCWGVFTAPSSARFVYSDMAIKDHIIPLCPTHLLALDYQDKVLSVEEVDALNRSIFMGAHRFIFSHTTDKKYLAPLTNSCRV